MNRIIKKNNIAPLIKDLQRRYEVYAPVRKGDVAEPFRFRHVSEAKPQTMI